MNVEYLKGGWYSLKLGEETVKLHGRSELQNFIISHGIRTAIIHDPSKEDVRDVITQI